MVGEAAQQKQESHTAASDKLFGLKEAALTFWPIWPYFVGMAFARSGLIVACYGSYDGTDNDVFTDGAMLVTLALFALLLVYVFLSKKRFSEERVRVFASASIIAEALMLIALAAVDLADISSFALSFSLSVACTIASSFAMYYWLRIVCGAGTISAVVFAFSSLALSEVIIFLCGLMPIYAGDMAAAALVLAQFACMAKARKGPSVDEIADVARRHDFFSFTRNILQSAQFLIAIAIGIGGLSFVVGFLRGYPDGLSIEFSLATRLGYGAMTILLCGAFVLFALRNRPRVMTVGIFLFMETLACLALVFYAAFPDRLDIGAMFTTTLNALICAYCWYVIIAFSTYGWRDPVYYALAGWLVCFGARAIARMALLAFYPALEGNDMLVNAIMGALLVLSTQVTLVTFGSIRHGSEDEGEVREDCGIGAREAEKTTHLISAAQDSAAEGGGNGNGGHGGNVPPSGMPQQPAALETSPLVKIMGLDSNENLASMRQAAMRHSAEVVGKQFLLSDREVDVLALYALGFTQKRVAEELFISPGTAHAHIKRIYAKTGMHSRQEILGYIEQYAS